MNDQIFEDITYKTLGLEKDGYRYYTVYDTIALPYMIRRYGYTNYGCDNQRDVLLKS